MYNYKKKYNKVDVEGVLEYEERGLALIEKHRENIIRVANKRPDYYFNHMFKDYVHEPSSGRRYIFIPSQDPDCKVLAVAHLDTVQCPVRKGFSFNTLKDEHGLSIVKMTTCDDRLGVATILYVLPEMGIDVDIMFTDLEEKGHSTAAEFKSDKKYNHIVEFDRGSSYLAGESDAVVYAYWDKGGWNKTLEGAGFRSVDRGTNTDISDLQHLGAKALNVAVGYYNYHASDAYFRVGEWMRGIELYKSFYDQHKDTHFKHEKKEVWPVPYVTQNVTQTYSHGQVVMTSPYGRADKTPQVGYLSSNLRLSYWTIVGENGYVIDVINTNSYQITKGFKCPNCHEKVFNEHNGRPWHEVCGHVLCGKCWQVCQKLPEIVVDAIITGEPVDLNGEIYQISCAYRDGEIDYILMNKHNMRDELVIETIDVLTDAKPYIRTARGEQLVVVNDIYLDINVKKNIYFVKEVVDDMLGVQEFSDPSGQIWMIPSYIVVPVEGD